MLRMYLLVLGGLSALLLIPLCGQIAPGVPGTTIVNASAYVHNGSTEMTDIGASDTTITAFTLLRIAGA